MSDDGETLGSEAAREVLGLVFFLLATGGAVLVERWMRNPDAARTLRMRAARRVESLAARVAVGAVRVADRAERAYQSERP